MRLLQCSITLIPRYSTSPAYRTLRTRSSESVQVRTWSARRCWEDRKSNGCQCATARHPER
jgi:hypothetical protein